MGDPEHQVVLTFAKSNNEKTVISCVCGEHCGTVPTGTKVSEILDHYREHTKS